MNAGARTLYSLAEDGYFPRSFGSAHPRNATPHRAIALLGVLAVAATTGLLAAGVPLVSCIDYLSQLAALGFIGSYFMVCLAVPFFLRRLASLRLPALAASASALVLLSAVMVESIYPAPEGPARFLPYVFMALLAAGVSVSWWVRRGAAPTPTR
jgi:amino acid transporter